MPIPLFLILLAQAAPANTDPLAPSAQGKLECTVLDPQRKTCRSLASYRATGNGSYASTATILIAPQGPVTIEMTTPVTIKAGRACTTLRNEDFAGAKVKAAGQPVTDAQTTQVVSSMTQALAPLMGKEICASYEPDGTGFVEKAYVEGEYQAGMDQKILWVDPKDGYTVAP
jgi:hypothetical protein